MREEDGLGDGDAEFGGEGIVEELVVCGPPEGIVDDLRARKDSVLQKGAVEGHVVRDAIDDDGVAGRFGHADTADVDELGLNSFDLHGVDFVDEGAGKGIFHSKQNTDLLHVILQLVT